MCVVRMSIFYRSRVVKRAFWSLLAFSCRGLIRQPSQLRRQKANLVDGGER